MCYVTRILFITGTIMTMSEIKTDPVFWTHVAGLSKSLRWPVFLRSVEPDGKYLVYVKSDDLEWVVFLYIQYIYRLPDMEPVYDIFWKLKFQKIFWYQTSLKMMYILWATLIWNFKKGNLSTFFVFRIP